MQEETGLPCCLPEEDPRRPNLSPHPLAPGGSRCPRGPGLTAAARPSRRGAGCPHLDPTWAPSPTARPLQSPARHDPSSPVCTTGGPRPCPGFPGSPAPGRPRPLTPATEVQLSGEAPCGSRRRAPPPPSPTGLPCPPPRAGPWTTSPRRRRPRWATGRPCTARRCRHRRRRTANPRWPPPPGPPQARSCRPRRRRRPAGRDPRPCPRAPAATKSRGSRSGTCRSPRPLHRAPRPDGPARCLPRPAKGRRPR